MDSPSLLGFIGVLSLTTVAGAQSSWPMRQRDVHNTGRSTFVVPASRMNAGLFDAVRWQTPSPGSPTDGALSATQMVYFDGAGPVGADLVVGSYHWPKGVQGMNRHTGRVYWSGNPAGGENIGRNTAAFGLGGSTLYVTNDHTATSSPLMAMNPVTGPGSFWSNVGFNIPDAGTWSPKVLWDGRIMTSNWCEAVSLFQDTGTTLHRVSLMEGTCSCHPTAAAYNDSGLTRIYVASRCGFVSCYDGDSGLLLWRTNVAANTDAAITVDPTNGNVYTNVGLDDIWVVGLNKFGQPLWTGGSSALVHDWLSGINLPERAASAGALSHDGGTYYFQTVGVAGNGRLYAINTTSGTLKWVLDTQSRGGEMFASSPIVTPNSVVLAGNNGGRAYYAVRDDGTAATMIAMLDNAPSGGEWDGLAAASATLSADGLLYLPIRQTWVYPYAGGPAPSGQIEYLFTAIDLNADPTILLPSPTGLRAVAGNASIRLDWGPVAVNPAVFSHYAVYRAHAAFQSVDGLTPIATISNMAQSTFVDSTAMNGHRYHYAVTSVAIGGDERREVSSIGPRTPRDETDLQVVTIRRTPEYPRYEVLYTDHLVTEPGGFGPYWFSSATGLGGGQTGATQRWPNVGEQVTYTATVRNRGTNAWSSPVSGRWLVDGQEVATAHAGTVLSPGTTVQFELSQVWDGQSHDIRFEIQGGDARAQNNALTVGSKSVAFLSYIDRTYAEDFRESTMDHPTASSDDMIDWLNHHMARFNQMFEQAGTAKRVHYGVLEMLEDAAPNPAVPTINYAIFPFRFRAGEGSLRQSGYFSATDDIDYGLLHEMGHQLGLIDIYQIDTPPEQNLVTASGFNAVDCLMRTVAPFLSRHSADAMTHWLDVAHGYYGQYIYGIPQNIRLRLLGTDGQPLAGAQVRVYQKVDRPGQGTVITNQVKFSGTTDSLGYWTLPNVPINRSLVPTTFAGDTLPDNPFGYLAVVGNNGLLLFEVTHQEATDHAWLSITEVNDAFRAGQSMLATFERRLALGGGVQYWPPSDMAELNPDQWTAWAASASASLFSDTMRRQVGAGSIRMVTDGPFDTYARYPRGVASWDLTGVQTFRFWAFAENTNIGGFQGRSPWVRLRTASGFIDLMPTVESLSSAIGQWREFQVPLAGSATWERTTTGAPSISRVNSIEVHADTWGSGFVLWLDGAGFLPRPCFADFNGVGGVTVQDVFDFLEAYFSDDSRADVNASGTVTVQDVFEFLAAWFGVC